MTPDMRHHVRDLLERVDLDEMVRRRAVQEAVTDALAHTWTRRAEVFEWAAPKPGDFTGRATAAELAERQARCEATALACRQKAALLERRWIDA